MSRRVTAPRRRAEAKTKRISPGNDRAKPTVLALIGRGARRLRRAGVFFGHGTDNAWDDSAALVLHALGLPHCADRAVYSRRVDGRGVERADELIRRRIEERIPAVYLTGETWFAGLPFQVDRRVLIPRSPLAELIERRFAPWIDAGRVRRILDVGTGSGCIAIACAKALPRSRVDAVDISPEALEVAAVNVRRHRLGRRVRLVRSDHFSALARERYDIILANPPYVGRREMSGLPPEYRHEPPLALAAGRDGLDSVRVILREAGRHLRPGGLLIVEVGNTETAVRRAFERLPFLWLEFERGGGGVFLLTAEQLV
ncbi:MAG: 50S ribosomal protein L3 N(5)-glutamine methyltransferase [Gammaproteobacteria bacterium]|nr:50S ribosomal protein L3 N(5)-glutamine methyltransferase [Gammaproteobacteria bacterium]MDE2262481.1 50S ribosomal protein L3 N(5)-glutamine methyltransferase [Gammaproteobacteria bacterium]